MSANGITRERAARHFDREKERKMKEKRNKTNVIHVCGYIKGILNN